MSPSPALTVKTGVLVTLRGLVAPGYTEPASSSPRVLAISHSNGSTAQFRAVAPGVATITINTDFCLEPSATRHCPAMTVTVKATD